MNIFRKPGFLSGGLRTPAMVSASVLSGCLLAAAFSPWEKAALAWLAFVPLLVCVRHAEPRRAFWFGGIAGLVYWLISIAWLLRLMPHAPAPLVVLGWLSLAAYAALYSAVFVWAYSAAWRWLPFRGISRNLAFLAGAPIVWVGLEYIRSRLFTGFPWNPLGASQYRNLPLIQIAEWVGVHGVSALVMLFNVSLTLTLLRYVDSLERRRGFHLELAAAGLLIAICWRVGVARERFYRPPAVPELQVAVLQTGVPQSAKWDEEMVARIFENLRLGIEEAAVQATIRQGYPPDIIVLPETVFPYYDDHPLTQTFMREMLHIFPLPISAGVMAREPANNGENYFNRSVLYLPGESEHDFYDKQHLVPFGEVIPLSRWIPWLENFAPLGWNCMAGTEAKVFQLPHMEAPFSVTICFEDAFPYISRRFARAGARWLLNQTNDAWFDPSGASRQHLALGVFRSVETRLPTVRAANTGVSALIGRNGRIRHELPTTDPQEPARIAASWRLTPAPEGENTFFTRYGDWTFALPSAIIALGILALTYKRMRF